MGWATVTHPFHPLRGQRFEVLKTRRAAGVDSLILRHPERGSYTVVQDWTDWGLPDVATGEHTRTAKLDAALLMDLAELLATLDKRAREGLDE